MTKTVPSLRAGARDPRIAKKLRELRQDTGMSAAEAAVKAGFSETKICRVERAIGSVTIPDLTHLLGIYAASQADTKALLDLAMRVADRGVKGRPRAATTEVYQAEAVTAWSWGPALIPTPLRAAGYAAAAAGGVAQVMGWMPSQVREAARVSDRWLERLTARRDPLRLEAVIDATALRRRVAPADTMAEQLAHLAWLAERPNVTLKVLPLDTRGPLGWAAFTVLSFDETDDLRMADIALPDEWGFTEPSDVEVATWRCRQHFARLLAEAEPPGPAIAAASKHWNAAR